MGAFWHKLTLLQLNDEKIKQEWITKIRKALALAIKYKKDGNSERLSLAVTAIRQLGNYINEDLAK